MDSGTGKLYASVEDMKAAGVKNGVELIGASDDIQRISAAVSAQYRAKQKAKRKAQKKARRNNR